MHKLYWLFFVLYTSHFSKTIISDIFSLYIVGHDYPVPVDKHDSD